MYNEIEYFNCARYNDIISEIETFAYKFG